LLFTGAFSDLMWSDPDSGISEWVQSQRGAGYLFGEKVTREVVFFLFFVNGENFCNLYL
jgi:diadenosine tetraphosphatase ApaH/serine/threonine PP2A family protein phosphatase